MSSCFYCFFIFSKKIKQHYPAACLILLSSVVFVGCHKKNNSSEKITTLARGSYNAVQMANGALVSAEVKTKATTNTALSVASLQSSYELNLVLNVALPIPATTLASLQEATPEITTALPWLAELAAKEKGVEPSSYFAMLYENKIKALNHQLANLGQLLARPLLYDCQTILELKTPQKSTRVLMIQALMNVNTDGSDGDRNISLEKLSSSYQPQTNYRWPKTSSHPNPNNREFEIQLTLAEIALKDPATSSEQKIKLTHQITTLKTIIEELQRWSFLIGSADPFIVLPKFMLEKNNNSSASIGDYAIVLYQGTLYPAVVGDIGPSSKIGEASLRICRAIDPRSSGDRRPLSSPHISYFVFPGSAEYPLAKPDYKKWSDRCHQLWSDLGGSPNLTWHEWTNLEQPWP